MIFRKRVALVSWHIGDHDANGDILTAALLLKEVLLCMCVNIIVYYFKLI